MRVYKAFDAAGNSTSVTLGDLIGSGGEGSVRKTNLGPNVIAKVYNDARGTENKYNKCRYFIESGFDYDGIAFPTHLLLDSDNAFVGYLMPKAKGCTLAEIMNPLELREEHPHLERKHLVDVCISILDKICYLHRNGILVCDISMRNILVDGLDTEHIRTYFVDCDSYQVGEGKSAIFLGEVGRPAFTPPELQAKKLDQQKRTFSNEYFSVAVLLFMILIPGQNPYAMRGGPSTQGEGVKGGLFPYPKDTSKLGNKIPSKWCQYLWSYLPMGELFWENLHAKGSHYSPAARTNPKTWLLWMEDYKKALTDGTVAREDPEGLKAFPERPKRMQSNVVARTPIQTQSQQAKPQQPAVKAKASNPYANVGRRPRRRRHHPGNSNPYANRRVKYQQEISQIKRASELDREDSEKGFFEDKSSWIVVLLMVIIAALYYWNPLSFRFQYAIDLLSGWLPSSYTRLRFYFMACYPLAWSYFTIWLVHRFLRRPLLKKRAVNLEKLYDTASRQEYFGANSTDAKYINTIHAANSLVSSRKSIEWILSSAVALLLAFAFYFIAGLASSSMAANDGLSAYDNKTNGEMYVQGINGEIAINAAKESTYGNEEDFVQAVACNGDLKFDGSAWNGESIDIAVGEPYLIRVFVRNDSKEAAASANNVHVANKVTRDGTDLVYTFSVTYDSAPEVSNSVSDSVKVHFNSDWTKLTMLDAQLRSKEITAEEGRKLIDYDALYSDAGCLVGTSSANGVIPGGQNGYCILYFFSKAE